MEIDSSSAAWPASRLGSPLEGERVAVWTWLVLGLALATIYALTLENGTVLRAGAETVHELFHDGRHLLGVPCH